MLATRTLQVTLPLADAAFLRRQSRNMGWEVTTVRSPRTKQPKVVMTKEEYFRRLDEAEKGPSVAMLPGEDLTAFLRRQGYDL